MRNHGNPLAAAKIARANVIKYALTDQHPAYQAYIEACNCIDPADYERHRAEIDLPADWPGCGRWK